MPDYVLGGRYRLRERLGAGGMAEVWLADDLRLPGKLVAVKRMHGFAASADPAGDLERARREAMAVSQLSHPHIVGVTDFVTESGEPFIVMEYVNGTTARDAAGERGLPPYEAARLVAEVADALTEAHRHGVVHRDVKPSNILIDARGSAKLADFGIAVAGNDPRLTRTGEFTGSIAYTAPEVLRGGAVTAAGDMWALGATLYELVTGRLAFDGPTGSAVIASVLMNPPPSLGPDRLGRLVAALLDHDPARRPDAATAAAELRAVAAGVTDDARPTVAGGPVFPPASPMAPAPLTTPARRGPRPKRRNQVLTAVIAVAVVVAALTTGLVLTVGGDDHPTAAGPDRTSGTSGPTSRSASGSAPGVGNTPSSSVSAGALPGAGKPRVVFGTKDFDEQLLLGQLYAQALRARGYDVTLKQNIGSSEVIDKALSSKQIDLYPEYTGVIYSSTFLAGRDDYPTSAEATYDVARDWEAARGYRLLEPTPFADADGIAVRRTLAARNGLKTISDLKKLGSFTYGGPADVANRYQGVVGLKQRYGLSRLVFKAVTVGTQYRALDTGAVDTAAIFTSDGSLASGRYTVLTDPEGIFGYQNVAPVVDEDVLSEQGPAFEQTLNRVSEVLTQRAVIAMNFAVQLQQKDPAVVAKQFLAANGLA